MRICNEKSQVGSLSSTPARVDGVGVYDGEDCYTCTILVQFLGERGHVIGDEGLARPRMMTRRFELAYRLGIEGAVWGVRPRRSRLALCRGGDCICQPCLGKI